MKLLYFKGNPPNFGDELNRYIFEDLFRQEEFSAIEPGTYFMGVGSILHPAYLNRFAGETADRITGHDGYMNKGVVFGSGVREHRLDHAPETLDIRFVRGPISSRQTGATNIADAAYLLPLLTKHAPINGLPKKHAISLMPYFHHAFSMDYDRIASETGVNIIQPYADVETILRDVQQSELVISGAMHGCIAADIQRVPWIRLRLITHEANPVVQTVKWRDFAESMELDSLATIRMQTENFPDKRDNNELENELIHALSRVSAMTPSLSDDAVFNDRIERLASAVRDFSHDYAVPLDSSKTIVFS